MEDEIDKISSFIEWKNHLIHILMKARCDSA